MFGIDRIGLENLPDGSPVISVTSFAPSHLVFHSNFVDSSFTFLPSGESRVVRPSEPVMMIMLSVCDDGEVVGRVHDVAHRVADARRLLRIGPAPPAAASAAAAEAAPSKPPAAARSPAASAAFTTVAV